MGQIESIFEGGLARLFVPYPIMPGVMANSTGTTRRTSQWHELVDLAANMERGLTTRRNKVYNNENKDGSKAKLDQALTLSSAAGKQHQNLLCSQFMRFLADTLA